MKHTVVVRSSPDRFGLACIYMFCDKIGCEWLHEFESSAVEFDKLATAAQEHENIE